MSTRGRRGRLGAALVECAVVLPVTVVFYGVLVFVFKEYELKLELMGESRDRAFGAALAQCRDVDGLEALPTRFETLPAYDRVQREWIVPGIVREAGLESFVAVRSMTAHVETRGVASSAGMSQLLRERTLTADSDVSCVPLGLDRGASYVGPARRASLRVVDDVMGAALAALRDLFSSRLKLQ